MHVEVTPMGKLLGKVLRGLLKTSLYCIPIGIVIVVLFYGVQCTKSLASAVFGPSRQANPYAVVTQSPPHTVPVVPFNKPAPITNTNPQPAVPAPLPIDNGRGKTNVAGTPPTYDPGHVAHQPAKPPYVIDAETEYVMFWYFGDIPHRFAKTDNRHGTIIPTTKPAPPIDRSDPPPALPKIAAAAPVTSAPPQQHVSSFLTTPPVAVSPSGQSQTVSRDRQATARPATPDVRRSSSATNHTQNPSSVAHGSQADRSRGNPSNRGQTTQSPKGSPPSNPNQQQSGSDNRRGRSNDSVNGR